MDNLGVRPIEERELEGKPGMGLNVRGLFRERPGAEPSGKTPIRGAAACTAAELAEFAARRRQPAGEELAEAYLRLGERYGVRGDLAFCQALYETRGLANGRVRPIGEARPTDLWGLQGRVGPLSAALAERQIRQLYAFATREPFPEEAPAPDSEMEAEMEAEAGLRAIDRKRWRGAAPHWEDLNGKWSYPGANYGQDIVAVWRNLLEWAGERRRREERYRQAP